MTKLLGIGVLALGLIFTAGTLSGCDKADDKDKTEKKAEGDKKADGDNKTDGDKKVEATTDGKKKDGKATAQPGDKAAAAGTSATPPAGDPKAAAVPAADVAKPDPAMTSLIKIAADDVCKCKDAACAKKVGQRMQKWVTAELAKRPSPKEKTAFALSLRKNYKADMDRGQKCAAKLNATKVPGKATGVLTGAAVKKFGTFADKLCGCKDAKCAASVAKEMQVWGKAQKGMQPDPKDMQALMAIQKRFAGCYTKILKASTSKTMPKNMPKKK